MLRIPAAIAVLGLSALTLAACASAPSAASCERVDSDASVLDVIDPSGAFGSPGVAIGTYVHAPQTVFTDATVGDGTRVTSDLQDVAFTVTFVNGDTGERVTSGSTQPQPVSAWRENYNGLATMLMCATEGSRIVGAIPASDLSQAAAQGFGLSDDQSLAVVLDLTKVYLPAADGAPQYNDRRGMPSVVLAPDGRPGVIVPDADAPADPVVQTLKKGSGAAVAETDSVRVHYTSVDWKTRRVLSSTWENGASTAVKPTEASVPFAGDLVGVTVGSQLLIVLPPTADGKAATIYVVDVLGIDAAAATQ